MKPRVDVQPIDKKGVAFALAALAFAAIYQALWYIAPELMRTPVAGVIPFSVPFGIAAIFMPLLFAWLCARNDVASDEVYDTSKH